jgi:predicted O-methyltransferase YrrM
LINIRRLLGRAFEGAAAPFGARAVERMLRDGMPARLALPLRVLFGASPPAHAIEVAERIETLRAALAGRAETFQVSWSTDPRHAVTARYLAEIASVPRRWGMFLHVCAEAFEAQTIVELGACLGISGAYLASIRSQPRLITIEASEARVPIARSTLASVTDRAEVVPGTFEERLQSVLDRAGRVDVVYVDGHHAEAATIHYVRTVMPYLASEALVVLDDIHLFRDMWRAWQTVSSMPGVTAVNIGRFGLLVTGSGTRGYDLSRYSGWWRVGGPRAVQQPEMSHTQRQF